MIDDDPGIRDLVVEYLRKNDMRVSAGVSGREMFEIIDREAIDLVLLDLKLPGRGWHAAGARPARARHRTDRLLTGRNEEADRVMGLELGADDYVTKPFSPRELLARVRAVLRRYQVQATLPERDNTRRAFPLLGVGAEPAHPAPDVARRAARWSCPMVSSACSTRYAAHRSVC